MAYVSSDKFILKQKHTWREIFGQVWINFGLDFWS